MTLTKDGIEITNYKTTKSAWSDSKTEEHAPQLRLYGDLFSQSHVPEPGKLSLKFVTITKAKEAKVATFEVRADDARLAATRTQLKEVWAGVRGSH